MIKTLGRTLWAQGIILVFLTYIVYLSLRSFVLVPAQKPDQLENPSQSGFFDYRGVVNIHTSNTGGVLSGSDLVRSAESAGLDWIFMSDLNTGVPTDVPEKRYGQLLVLHGAKFDYLGSRVLALNPDRLAHPESLGQAQTVIADILSEPPLMNLKDLLIFEKNLKSAVPIRANKNISSAAIGEEILNLREFLLSRWTDAPLTTVWSLLILPFNMPLALHRLLADFNLNSQFWDQPASPHQGVGTLGHDILPTQSYFGLGTSIESVADYFRFASVHLLTSSELTGDFKQDKEKILRALAGRHAYFAFDSMGPTRGFSFVHQARTSKSAFDTFQPDLIGSRVNWARRGRFVISLPRRPDLPFEAVLIRNGQAVMTANSETSSLTVSEPGHYRVLVRLFTSLSILDGRRWVPWIITNPIEVKAEGQR